MALVLGTNTWISEADADTYFASRLGASSYWTSGAEKEAALVTAFNQLNSMSYAFPSTIAQNMKDAQCEQALFLLIDTGIDARIGLQVQNVKSAGIVKETYDSKLEGPPISLAAKALLTEYISYSANERGTFLSELERNETEGATYDYE